MDHRQNANEILITLVIYRWKHTNRV